MGWFVLLVKMFEGVLEGAYRYLCYFAGQKQLITYIVHKVEFQNYSAYIFNTYTMCL